MLRSEPLFAGLFGRFFFGDTGWVAVESSLMPVTQLRRDWR
jgi:hypothetical protein